MILDPNGNYKIDKLNYIFMVKLVVRRIEINVNL